MGMIFTIATREWKSLFLSPLAWSILGIFQGIAAYLFLAQVQRFLSIQEKLAALDNAPGFTGVILPAFYADAGILLLLATPLLTMRLISEERRNKTLTLLQAAPLSNTQIVLGKALGVFAFLLVAIALISVMPCTLALGGTPDFGLLAANVFALALLALLLTCVGLFCSCLTRYPALAALSAIVLLLLLWLLDWTNGMGQKDNPVLQYVSLLYHFQNLQSGLIDSTDVLYFLCGSALFLVLSVYQLDKQRFPDFSGFRALWPVRKTLSEAGFPRNTGMRLKHLAVTAMLLVVIGIGAWCGWRWHSQTDWTIHAGNTLSEASRKTLESLPDEARIDVYLDDEEKLLRRQIAQLLRLYRQHKPNMELRFIDPKKHPQALRELGVDGNSAVFVNYQGRAEQLSVVNETTLTNALLQLSYGQERWISVLSGHGERSAVGKANYDFGAFGEQLRKRQQKLQELNLGQLSAIPDNTSLLVIADPRTDFLPVEMDMVLAYLHKGGNLLWLADPGAAALPALSAELGINLLPGVIVDHKAQLYSVNDPSFVLLTDYPPHPLTAGLQDMTLFPQAVALQNVAQNTYQTVALLRSSEQSWTETGPVAGTIAFDPQQNEARGPVDLGFTLTRLLDNGGEQRIAVIGDGDFWSNAYLGNVGNREFGFKLINWLTHQDRFIAIPIRRVPDAQLNLDLRTSGQLAYAFLVILPALLLGSGFGIWFMRKRR